MRKPLYQIESDYLAIADALEQGELTPELETALAITEQELQVKAVGYGYIIKDAEDTVDAIDAEIKRLQARKKSEQNKVERMKEAISNAMQHFGIYDVKTPTLRLSFRKSERVVGMSFDELPDEFVTVVPEQRKPNLNAIKSAIKEGREIGDYRVETIHNLQIK
jgi:hypothetical protein